METTLQIRTLGSDKTEVNVNLEKSDINDLKKLIEAKLGSEHFSIENQFLILRGQDITSYGEKLINLEMKSSDHLTVMGDKISDPLPPITKNLDSLKNNNKSAKKLSQEGTFVPDPKAIEQLTECGFDRNEVIRALQMTPDLEVATEILVSGSKNLESVQGFESSTDGNTEVYQQIKELIQSQNLAQVLSQSNDSKQSIFDIFCSHLSSSNNQEGIRILLENPTIFNKVITDMLGQSPELDESLVSTIPDNLDLITSDEDKASLEDDFNVDDMYNNEILANLTEDDHKMIENLTDLGYSKEKSTIAYIACNKNVNEAAEFLTRFNPENE